MAVNAHAIQAEQGFLARSRVVAFFEAQPLTEAERPSVAPQPFHEAGTFRSEEIEIPARDARLAGTLYVPQSPSYLPAPAVVFVHGAGPAVRSDGYRELAEHFARSGVAALIFDKRGCGASEGDWTRASLSDLAGDALACAGFLRGRGEINPQQIGLWGLSQGASIIPIAAARSPEVSFVIAVGGCMDFEEAMRYFRANVFRGFGYSTSVLDIANKAELIQMDLSNRIRSGAVPVPRAWRESRRFEFDLDHAAIWQQVRQPVLAIYGELDRQVPVAPSSQQLTAVVARSGNRDFTRVVYPGASHAIGRTRTGELGEDWIGYDPDYLKDMTDWVLRHTTGAKSPGAAPAVRLPPGPPREAAQPIAAGHYDRLRWYGNSIVQSCLFLVFAGGFLSIALAGTVRAAGGMTRKGASNEARTGRWVARGAVAIAILNLSVLTGLVCLIRRLSSAWDPAYPAVLNYLPLVGTLSALATLVWLALVLG